MSLQQQTEKYRRLVRSERFRDRLKRMSFPGFEGIPVYDVFLKFREEIKEDGLSIRASPISYFFILALFPLNGLKGILPIGIFSILETTIHDIVSVQRGGLVSINFFLALFVASNGVNSIMRAFDKMNQTFKKRNFFQKKIAAFQIISFVVRFTKTLLILFSFFNIFALIYYFGPSVKKRYRYFSVGATFATLFSILMSIVFKFYTSYLNNFNRLYGSLGIMIVIMLLIYLNALVLLFGFELNNSIAVNKALRESEIDSNSDSDSEIKHL